MYVAKLGHRSKRPAVHSKPTFPSNRMIWRMSTGVKVLCLNLRLDLWQRQEWALSTESGVNTVGSCLQTESKQKKVKKKKRLVIIWFSGKRDRLGYPNFKTGRKVWWLHQTYRKHYQGQTSDYQSGQETARKVVDLTRETRISTVMIKMEIGTGWCSNPRIHTSSILDL